MTMVETVTTYGIKRQAIHVLEATLTSDINEQRRNQFETWLARHMMTDGAIEYREKRQLRIEESVDEIRSTVDSDVILIPTGPIGAALLDIKSIGGICSRVDSYNWFEGEPYYRSADYG